MAGRPKYDWETIREFYIAGKVNPQTGENADYSYNQIAIAFNVKHRSTVKLHAEKGNWKADREKYKKQHLDTLRAELRKNDLPSLLELRGKLMKVHLGIINKGLQDIDAGELDVRGVDIHNSSKFLIDQYHFIFGVPQEQQPAQDVNLHIDFKDDDELYRAANSYVRKNSNGS